MCLSKNNKDLSSNASSVNTSGAPELSTCQPAAPAAGPEIGNRPISTTRLHNRIRAMHSLNLADHLHRQLTSTSTHLEEQLIQLLETRKKKSKQTNKIEQQILELQMIQSNHQQIYVELLQVIQQLKGEQ